MSLESVVLTAADEAVIVPENVDQVTGADPELGSDTELDPAEVIPYPRTETNEADVVDNIDAATVKELSGSVLWNLEYGVDEIGVVYQNHKAAFVVIARNLLFARGLSYDRDLPEELVNDAFTSFYAHYVVGGAPLPGNATVAKTLCAIVRNRVLDRVKSAYRRQAILRGLPEEGLDCTIGSPTAEEEVMERLEAARRLGVLAVIWPRLTESQQQALLARFCRQEGLLERTLANTERVGAKRGSKHAVTLAAEVTLDERRPPTITLAEILGDFLASPSPDQPT